MLSWECIRDDLKTRPDSSMQEVVDRLSELETFTKKGTLPKMPRWFSWNQSAEENLKEFRAARVVLEHAFCEDSKLDPDDCEAQRQLSRAGLHFAELGGPNHRRDVEAGGKWGHVEGVNEE